MTKSTAEKAVKATAAAGSKASTKSSSKTKCAPCGCTTPVSTDTSNPALKAGAGQTKVTLASPENSRQPGSMPANPVRTINREDLRQMVRDADESGKVYLRRMDLYARSKDELIRFLTESRDHYFWTLTGFMVIANDLADGKLQLA